jgi:hypothetical protein
VYLRQLDLPGVHTKMVEGHSRLLTTMLDRATLLAHEPFWGTEAKRMLRNLTRLTHEEHSLYDDLRDQRIRRDIRLEQERIRFSHLRQALVE